MAVISTYRIILMPITLLLNQYRNTDTASGWETTYTEIVPSDRLRPKSTEPSITAKTFITFQLDVPRELQVRSRE